MYPSSNVKTLARRLAAVVQKCLVVCRVTYKDSRQKTRIVYIPRSGLTEIRRMIANYAKTRKITEQLIETNIEIFKMREAPWSLRHLWVIERWYG